MQWKLTQTKKFPEREIQKQKVRVLERNYLVGKHFLYLAHTSAPKCSYLHQGWNYVWSRPRARSRSRSRTALFSFLVLVVLAHLLCSVFAKCSRRWKSGRKCGGRSYPLGPELARAAELPVGLTVCRVHWDKIRRNNNKCSVPGKTHSKNLHEQPIPIRHHSVLDAIGKEKEQYNPGTRWCTECCMQVDKLDEFITRPEYQPPPTRTAKQKVSLNAHPIIFVNSGKIARCEKKKYRVNDDIIHPILSVSLSSCYFLYWV